MPRGVVIHETYNPGAVREVSVFAPDQEETVVWMGSDPTPAGSNRGASRIDFETGFPVDEVRITLDSRAVPGWNEIDAVGLIDEAGNTHWAIDADASSTYATGWSPSTPGTLREMIPYWCSSWLPRDGVAGNARAGLDERMFLATGWPLRALRREAAVPPSVGGLAPTLWASPPWMSIRGPSAIPYVPIWSGLIVDTVFYAMLWWLLVVAIQPVARLRPVRVARESWRARQGRCAACGFDLRFDLARGCPECGWRRSRAESRK
jgi:hypothetical protein